VTTDGRLQELAPSDPDAAEPWSRSRVPTRLADH